MSYRHIKGLILRHNNIRASGEEQEQQQHEEEEGGLMKIWGNLGFKCCFVLKPWYHLSGHS